VVLKYAGVKSWSAFERGLRVWDLKENDGIFQIAGNTRVSHGWPAVIAGMTFTQNFSMDARVKPGHD
jgi:hypothetical protein